MSRRFEVAVRTVLGWLFFLLLGAGWWATEFEPSSRAGAPRSPAPWRRTERGWERIHAWHQPSSLPPRLDPQLLAAFQALASFWVLLAFPSRNSPPADRPATGAANGGSLSSSNERSSG